MAGINSVVPALLCTAGSWTGLDIVFYINLGCVLCAFVVCTTLVVLCKKTTCASVSGLVAILLFGLSFFAYIAQLVVYVYRYDSSASLVYMCVAFLALGFIAAAVYCVMLSRNSHSFLCLLTGLTMLVPPVGAFLSVVLSYKIKRDTRFRALVFNGYAYTYAALGAFCSRLGADFADTSGDEEFENLDKKGIKRKLKELKTKRATPEGSYRYGAALLFYKPVKYKKAIRALKKAAKGGSSAAQFNLGYYSEAGIYIKYDRKKSREYYSLAADGGDVDARMRLGILDISEGKVEQGVKLLNEMAEHGNLCAQYNLGVCSEKGLGVPQNFERALDIYTECAQRGFFQAQKRIFSLAADGINSPQNGDFFRHITSRNYGGSFDIMIKGLVEIKKRHAADAANVFISAIKSHDKWEGFARCLVGTLYIDCGKLPEDRANGAAYIKSAIPLEYIARDLYAAIPRSIIKGKGKASKQ